MFGAPAAASGGGLFGKPASAPGGGSIFGTSVPAGGGVFGGSAATALSSTSAQIGGKSTASGSDTSNWGSLKGSWLTTGKNLCIGGSDGIHFCLRINPFDLPLPSHSHGLPFRPSLSCPQHRHGDVRGPCARQLEEGLDPNLESQGRRFPKISISASPSRQNYLIPEPAYSRIPTPNNLR